MNKLVALASLSLAVSAAVTDLAASPSASAAPLIAESKAKAGKNVGTPEKGIRRLDPNAANERRVVCPGAWLYSGQ
jgi:hypothetical protein